MRTAVRICHEFDGYAMTFIVEDVGQLFLILWILNILTKTRRSEEKGGFFGL